MAERIAVQQQQRRAFAAVNGDDPRAAGLDLGTGKTFEEHSASQSLCPKE
jgi:hypothetical protein